MQTLPNGVKVPDGTDIVDPLVLLPEMARSFSDALGGLGVGKRQPRMYSVSNQTEKASLATLTGLANGDQVYLEDTSWWEIYDAGAWKVWMTAKPVPWPFAHTGISVGNGISNFAYSVYGDLITLNGQFTFGSSTSISGAGNNGRLVLPFPQWLNGASSIVGTCAAIDWSAGNHYSGSVIGTAVAPNNLAMVMFDNYSTAGMGVVASSHPHAWAASDVLSLNIRYRRA